MSTRRIIKSGRIQVQGQGAGPGMRTATLDPQAQAPGTGIDLQLKRQGDLVESIEVRCRCGRSATFDCLYDARQMEAGHRGGGTP